MVVAKHNFSAIERYAVFTVYDQHCYMCSKPLDFRSMHVDHVVPRVLLADESRLNEVLDELGLPRDFDLNDFGNWLPSCWPCNLEKGRSPFRTSLLVQRQLERARSRALRARQFVQRSLSRRRISDAFAILESAFGLGELTGEQIEPLVTLFLEDHPDIAKAYKNRIGLDAPEFLTNAPPLVELRLSETIKVVFSNERVEIVVTPLGAGVRAIGRDIDPSFYCGHCGSVGPWSGARCLTCGYLGEDH